jgi:hypothetical protein
MPRPDCRSGLSLACRLPHDLMRSAPGRACASAFCCSSAHWYQIRALLVGMVQLRPGRPGHRGGLHDVDAVRVANHAAGRPFVAEPRLVRVEARVGSESKRTLSRYSRTALGSKMTGAARSFTTQTMSLHNGKNTDARGAGSRMNRALTDTLAKSNVRRPRAHSGDRVLTLSVGMVTVSSEQHSVVGEGLRFGGARP